MPVEVKFLQYCKAECNMWQPRKHAGTQPCNTNAKGVFANGASNQSLQLGLVQAKTCSLSCGNAYGNRHGTKRWDAICKMDDCTNNAQSITGMAGMLYFALCPCLSASPRKVYAECANYQTTSPVWECVYILTAGAGGPQQGIAAHITTNTV